MSPLSREEEKGFEQLEEEGSSVSKITEVATSGSAWLEVKVRGLGLHAPFVPKWRLGARPLHVGMGTPAAWASPPSATATCAESCGLARAGVLAGLGGSRVTACDVGSLVKEARLVRF